MKGKLQKELPWLHWIACYTHRLELACKDAFSSQLFKDIVEMLLRLYYLYSKSPKKSRELAEIVEDLKEIWEFPSGGGTLPILTAAAGSTTSARHCNAWWTGMEPTTLITW